MDVVHQDICRSALGLNEPSIDVVNRELAKVTHHIGVLTKPRNFIGCEDDHEDDDEDAGTGGYLDRFLSDPGVRINDGAILSIEDLSQQLSISILVQNRSHHRLVESIRIA